MWSISIPLLQSEEENEDTIVNRLTPLNYHLLKQDKSM